MKWSQVFLVSLFFCTSVHGADAAAGGELETLQNQLLISVSLRNAEKFLAAEALLGIHGFQPKDYVTSTNKNLLHVLMTITREPNDPRSIEMLRLLLNSGVNPFQPDNDGQSAFDLALTKFPENKTYFSEMVRALNPDALAALYKDADVPIKKFLVQTHGYRPKSFGGMKAGLKKAHPMGDFDPYSEKIHVATFEILTGEIFKDIERLHYLTDEGQMERVFALLKDTYEHNPDYLQEILTYPLFLENKSISCFFSELLFHKQFAIVNWILNEIRLNPGEKNNLLSQKITTPQQTVQPLFLNLLFRDNTESANWLLNHAGLRYGEKKKLLEGGAFYPNGIKNPLLYELVINRKNNSADWLLNHAHLQPEQRDYLLKEYILLNDGSFTTLLTHILNAETPQNGQLASAYWLLNQAGLDDEEKDFLLTQKNIDPHGEEESLLFDLLLNKNFEAFNWLFRNAGLSAEKANNLLQEPANDGDDTLYDLLNFFEQENTLLWLMSDESALTQEQKRIIFGDHFEEVRVKLAEYNAEEV